MCFHSTVQPITSITFDTPNVENIGKNRIFSKGLNLQINPNKNLEFNPGLRYSSNTNTNDAITNNNTKVSTYSLNFNNKIFFLKSWLVGSEISKLFNNGYSSSLVGSANVITDSQNNRLSRYFMLSFTMRYKNLAENNLISSK